MSKNHRKLSEYEMNGERCRTVEYNKDGERIWVKPILLEGNKNNLIIPHLLDKSQNVNWRIKTSHFDNIDGIIASSGSICIQSGNFIISKELNAQVGIFPIDSYNPNNLVKNLYFKGNSNNSSTIVGNVDAPTWIGFATTSGTITLLQE